MVANLITLSTWTLKCTLRKNLGMDTCTKANVTMNLLFDKQSEILPFGK